MGALEIHPVTTSQKALSTRCLGGLIAGEDNERVMRWSQLRRHTLLFLHAVTADVA